MFFFKLKNRQKDLTKMSQSVLTNKENVGVLGVSRNHGNQEATSTLKVKKIFFFVDKALKMKETFVIEIRLLINIL